MKNNYINLLRGLAIFLMLWGHCIQCCIPNGIDFFENTIFKIIYSFHMPLFMLVSGYLFYFSAEKRTLKELLAHRCGGLIKIIVSCGILTFFMTTALFSIIDGHFMVVFNGQWLPSLSGLWFIWSVLSASLILAIVCKTIKKLWLQIIILLLGSVVVLLFPNGTNNFFMYPYYIIGFYFAKYKDSIPKKLLSVKYSSLILFPFLMFFFGKEHYIYTTGLLGGETLLQSIEIDLFRWFIGLIGSLCVIVLMQLLYDFIIRKNDKFFVWKATAYLGEKSLQIYTLSVIFLSSYLPILYSLIINLLPSIDTFFAQYIWVYNLGFTVVLAVLYCIGISIIIKLLEKTKISPILFGK